MEFIFYIYLAVVALAIVIIGCTVYISNIILRIPEIKDLADEDDTI